jgi:hypothetical protein
MAVNWNVSKSDLPVDLLARVPKPRALKVSGRSAPSLATIAQRVRAEYLEMPGLNLTREQARCLWALDADTCDQVLEYLVDSGFLVCTRHDSYVRADAG